MQGLEPSFLAGPVLGIGVDIVDVRRIQNLLERQGERFIGRVYTEVEQAYCRKFKHPAERFAARFAAKEAVAKAFSTGIGEALGWKSIAVESAASGQPQIKLDGKGLALLSAIGGREVKISLSHADGTAIAFAVIVGA